MSVPLSWQARAEAAERSVAVLKRKVRELCSGEQPSVLHRLLEQARRREEQNRRRQELADVRSQELEKYSRHLEAEVARRTRSIQMILENVSFGFLLVDRQLKLQDGFSRVCNDLFARRIKVGDDLAELLALSGKSEQVALTAAVEQVFEDVLPEELSLAQLPKRFVVHDVVLHLEGRVVRSAQGAVLGLLFNVTDATAIEATQKLSRNRDVLIGILRQKTAFEEFVADTRTNLKCAAETTCQSTLRRLVHTIKGNAGAWGLDEVVAAAHRIESELELGPNSVQPIEEALQTFLLVNNAVLGMRRLAHERPSDAADRTASIPSLVVVPGRRPASDLLGPVERYAYDLAARLGKTINVRVGGMDVPVDVNRMRPVLRALPHLIHNAIDHGIEPPSERGGKPPLGHLSIALSEHTDYWELEVTDDGRGVQLEKLAACSTRFGALPHGTSGATGLDLMFLDGVTTADYATEISGRGLGMAALREAVNQSGGKIDVTSSTDGTCVRIQVPVRATLQPTAVQSATLQSGKVEESYERSS